MRHRQPLNYLPHGMDRSCCSPMCPWDRELIRSRHSSPHPYEHVARHHREAAWQWHIHPTVGARAVEGDHGSTTLLPGFGLRITSSAAAVLARHRFSFGTWCGAERKQGGEKGCYSWQEGAEVSFCSTGEPAQPLDQIEWTGLTGPWHDLDGKGKSRPRPRTWAGAWVRWRVRGSMGQVFFSFSRSDFPTWAWAAWCTRRAAV
jgi:hypothetical protein